MGDRLLRKGLVVGIILLFFCINIQSTGTEIEQSTRTLFYSGNTLYVGGSGPNNYTRIQDAINDSVDGDTVFVYDDSSPYYEIVKVDKSINLVGEDKDTTIIDGDYYGTIVYIVSDWINISGFTIQNSERFYGIKIYSNHATITGNIISNGIYIISDSSGNTITRNNISENWVGIYLDGSSSNIITGNNISNNIRNGIFLGSSNNNIITSNNILNNDKGISLYSSSGNKITSNNIYNNGYGIEFYYSSVNIIIGNNIWNSYNWAGIFLDESNGNIIRKNNLIDNLINAEFYDSYDTLWIRNYWDDWLGVGPKIIHGFIWDGYYGYESWINFDWRPARKPYVITTTQGCDIE